LSSLEIPTLWRRLNGEKNATLFTLLSLRYLLFLQEYTGESLLSLWS
jgi:hypothetical protein